MFHCSGAQVRYTSITESTVSSAQNMPAPSKECVGVCGTVFVIGSLLAGCSTRSLRQKKNHADECGAEMFNLFSSLADHQA